MGIHQTNQWEHRDGRGQSEWAGLAGVVWHPRQSGDRLPGRAAAGEDTEEGETTGGDERARDLAGQ